MHDIKRKQSQAEDLAYTHLASTRPRALITRYAGALSRTGQYAETAKSVGVRKMMLKLHDSLAHIQLHETILSIGESCEARNHENETQHDSEHKDEAKARVED